MDKRKSTGRTCVELMTIFDNLPEAGLCFDVAHARQVDPTMMEAAHILRHFGERIREIHASGVRTSSTHGPISTAASLAYSSVAHLIPERAPIILESPVSGEHISSEILFAQSAFSPWLNKLRTEIDYVLNLKIDGLRKTQAECFFSTLQMSRIKLSDFEDVISRLPTGGAYRNGNVLLSSRELFDKLSEAQKAELKEHLLCRIRQLASEFPDLRVKFRDQFATIS